MFSQYFSGNDFIRETLKANAFQANKKPMNIVMAS